MGQDSKIEWTHHTFNPWRGCTKVSAGCAHCYAETQAKRNPKVLGIWGDKGTRVRAAPAYWLQPRRWDAEAKAAGERHRVFCASMADVFEDRPELVAWRLELIKLIDLTPHLDWLLLTKRPQNVRALVGRAISLEEMSGDDATRCGDRWLGQRENVWIGASVEDQAAADARIPELLNIPAVVRFLSVEPLLGRLT